MYVAGTLTTPAERHAPPRRTAPDKLDEPSPASAQQLLPAATTSSPTVKLNEVVIHLSTTLVIPDYDRFYSGDIRSFHPTYTSLDDGSLAAPPFLQDVRSTFITLLVTGAILFLFLRNTLVAADYLRRGKMRKKLLLYLMLCSQMLGVIAILPMIAATFNNSVDCGVIISLATLVAATSFALLITGILGIKAYRCLNNSRFVLVVLTLLQIASTVVIVLDVATVHGTRRIAGPCIRPAVKGYLAVFFPIQLAESLFICGCFLHAVYRSHGRPAVRGRMSVVLSLADVPNDIGGEISAQDAQDTPAVRRGWWDYVPNQDQYVQPKVAAREPTGPLRNFRLQLRLMWKDFTGLQSEPAPPQHKASAHSEYPTLQPVPTPPRQSTVQIRDDVSVQQRRERTGRRSISPAPSSISRLSKYIPRMPQLREMLRDELRYTAFITAMFVAITVMTVIGLNSKTGLSIFGWIAINWTSMSVLALQSLGRVIRRHERDALLQQPSLWDPAVRAEILAAEVSRRRKVGGPFPPSYLASTPHLRARRSAGDVSNNLAIVSEMREKRGRSLSSWKSAGEFRSIMTGTSGSVYPSPGPSIESFVPVLPHTRNAADPMILPSPDIDQFPTSGNTTPMPDSEKAHIIP